MTPILIKLQESTNDVNNFMLNFREVYWPMQIHWPSVILELILGLLWYFIHLLIGLFDLWSRLINNLECYLISSKLLPKYQNLHFERLKYLGVVVDSREANNILKIKQLLRWFSTIGVKYVVLYDIEGLIITFTTCLPV